ncbi:MAG: hypothetical protein K0R49_908 [Burkholderiales bacterium]|jgi:hypothetical protein|nr:hypothetical protein [Burkholderiales bacterium]
MNKKIFLLIGALASTASFALTETCPENPKEAVSNWGWKTGNTFLAASSINYKVKGAYIEEVMDQSNKAAKYEVTCVYDENLTIWNSYIEKITPVTSISNSNPSLPEINIFWSNSYKGTNKVQSCINGASCAWTFSYHPTVRATHNQGIHAGTIIR